MTPDGLAVVELSFESFAQFQEDYASYLSHEGLFIKTEKLYPPASLVRFRIRLPHDLVLAEGDGVVVWTREKGHPAGGNPGIAVRFISLEGESEKTIAQVVDKHIEKQGKPFDLANPDDPIKAEPKPAQPAAAAPAAKSSPGQLKLTIGGNEPKPTQPAAAAPAAKSSPGQLKLTIGGSEPKPTQPKPTQAPAPAPAAKPPGQLKLTIGGSEPKPQPAAPAPAEKSSSGQLKLTIDGTEQKKTTPAAPATQPGQLKLKISDETKQPTAQAPASRQAPATATAAGLPPPWVAPEEPTPTQPGAPAKPAPAAAPARPAPPPAAAPPAAPAAKPPAAAPTTSQLPDLEPVTETPALDTAEDQKLELPEAKLGDESSLFDFSSTPDVTGQQEAVEVPGLGIPRLEPTPEAPSPAAEPVASGALPAAEPDTNFDTGDTLDFELGMEPPKDTELPSASGTGAAGADAQLPAVDLSSEPPLAPTEGAPAPALPELDFGSSEPPLAPAESAPAPALPELDFGSSEASPPDAAGPTPLVTEAPVQPSTSSLPETASETAPVSPPKAVTPPGESDALAGLESSLGTFDFGSGMAPEPEGDDNLPTFTLGDEPAKEPSPAEGKGSSTFSMSLPDDDLSDSEATPIRDGDGVSPDDSLAFEEMPKPKSKRSRTWLLVLLVTVGLSAGGYYYKDQILELIPFDIPFISEQPVTEDQPVVQPTLVPDEPEPDEPEPDETATGETDTAETDIPETDIPEDGTTETEPIATPEQQAPTPVPTAAPPPQPTVRPPISTGPATAVVNLSWSQQGSQTVFTIKGNGTFSNNAFDALSLDDPPRVLVRIYRITEGFSRAEVEVGSPQVAKVRVGHHPDKTPVQLWFVFDLTNAGVKLIGTDVQGDTIRVRLQGG
jgi:uncharacterized protein (TIGR02266 family)